VPYSVARRRAAAAAPFPTPDFAALFGNEPDFLPPRYAAALWVAAGLLQDFEIDDTAEWLPPIAHRHGGPDLLTRMREVVGRVEAGLERGEVPFVGNMATQIAVAALIEKGEAVEDLAHEDAERWTWYLALDPDDMELRDLNDVLLPDLDHEFLFDPRFDGIENDDLMVNLMRAPNLHPRRWFEPFYENRPSSP
jgi:hypothetical protein